MDPKSWQVLLAGALGQLAVAVAIVGAAAVSGDRIGSLAGWYLVAFVLVAAAAATVPFALMRYGRRRRLAAAVSVLIGALFLWVNEFAPATWVFPLSLFAAGVLAWRESGTGTARPADG